MRIHDHRLLECFFPGGFSPRFVLCFTADLCTPFLCWWIVSIDYFIDYARLCLGLFVHIRLIESFILYFLFSSFSFFSPSFDPFWTPSNGDVIVMVVYSSPAINNLILFSFLFSSLFLLFIYIYIYINLYPLRIIMWWDWNELRWIFHWCGMAGYPHLSLLHLLTVDYRYLKIQMNYIFYN